MFAVKSSHEILNLVGYQILEYDNKIFFRLNICITIKSIKKYREFKNIHAPNPVTLSTPCAVIFHTPRRGGSGTYGIVGSYESNSDFPVVSQMYYVLCIKQKKKAKCEESRNPQGSILPCVAVVNWPAAIPAHDRVSKVMLKGTKL